MSSRIDFLGVRQRVQILDPSPRVNITDPLPEARMVAKYDTSGPHRSRILLFGRIGVSPVVACTVGSEPNLTYANDEFGLVMSTKSPQPANWVLAETVLDATTIVAAG